MARFFRRDAAKGASLLPELKRITNSGFIEVPSELMDPVISAVGNEENRKEVMKHLREGLAEPVAKHWKRIHASLTLLEALVQRGSGKLWLETAKGHHFDIVQRISFLEHFHVSSDKRAENMVRRKAAALRPQVIAKLENATDDDEEEGVSLIRKQLYEMKNSHLRKLAIEAGVEEKDLEDADDAEDTKQALIKLILDKEIGFTKSGGNLLRTPSKLSSSSSTCSPGSNSVGASISSISLSIDGDTSHGVDLAQIICPGAPKGPVVVNNMAKVGHNEDTTSESDGEESSTRSRKREKRRSKRRSTQECQEESQTVIPAASVNLLDITSDLGVGQDMPHMQPEPNQQLERPWFLPPAGTLPRQTGTVTTKTVDLLNL